MMRPPLDAAAFVLDPDHLWVMHCSEGPVPRTCAEAVEAWMGKELRPWQVRWREDAVGLPQALRQVCAQVIGAEASDISLTGTTSSGLVMVAQGFPWVPGDEVLLPLGEFPSNLWPWKALEARGVTLREVPLWEGHTAGSAAWESTPPQVDFDVEARLLEALGPRTRVLAVSWVRFQDGLKLDLQRLSEGCWARGVALVVDGIQGAGTASPNLRGVSAFATGGHKGLLGPQGIGFLWTDPAFRATLAPSGSWLSVEAADDFRRASTDHDRPWLPDGRRLEAGVPNLLGCAALLASVKTVLEPGVSVIGEHIRGLQEALLHALRTGPWTLEVNRLEALLQQDRLGSILGFHHGDRGPGGMQALLQEAYHLGIYPSVREGYMRVAFHGWHTEADVERLAKWLGGQKSLNGIAN